MLAVRTILFSIVTFWGAKTNKTVFQSELEVVPCFELKYHYISLRLVWSLIKKFENRCRNKHKVQIKLSTVQMCMTDFACYLLMQWQFWHFIWNGFLESTLRIKTVLLLFFSYFYSIMGFMENPLPDSWIVLHKKKTDIALIASRLMRYWISCAI